MRAPRRGDPGPYLIVVGASAGGIEALRVVLPTLPADLPAAVAVVVHRPPVQEDDRLTTVLSLNVRLPVVTASDGDEIRAGVVSVCPAGVHLVVRDHRYHLSTGPHENGSRPAIDVLFRTAARAFGPRAAGVVLSGMLDDGTAGLAAIKAHGGFAAVQDPAEAAFGDMPRNALENVAVDVVDGAATIAEHLVTYVSVPASARPVALETAEDRVEPSLFSCPDCGGVLSHVEQDGVLRFRCRTGHAYSPRTLFSAQEAGLEEALWVALRALVERHDMSKRLATRARDRGLIAAADRFEHQATIARQREEIVRAAIGRPELAVEAAEAAATTAVVESEEETLEA